jgi:hypothetical protein
MTAPKKPRVRMYGAKLSLMLHPFTAVRPMFYTEREGGNWLPVNRKKPNRTFDTTLVMLQEVAAAGTHSVLFDCPKMYNNKIKKGKMPLVRWDCINGVTGYYGAVG